MLGAHMGASFSCGGEFVIFLTHGCAQGVTHCREEKADVPTYRPQATLYLVSVNILRRSAHRY